MSSLIVVENVYIVMLHFFLGMPRFDISLIMHHELIIY
jgi:hypothetical protein